jgi:hypothetical protein
MTNNPDQPPTLPSGASGNFNFDQKGGTTNQTYINQAPPKLSFTPALGAELLTKIPKDKPITVEGVGSPSDWAVTRQIADFLVANGYQITLNLIGVSVPIPDHTLAWNAAFHVLTVAPSVR